MELINWLIMSWFLELDETSAPLFGNGEDVSFLNTENDRRSTHKRERRQVQNIAAIDLSVSQECEGITLRWSKPDIPHR